MVRKPAIHALKAQCRNLLRRYHRSIICLGRHAGMCSFYNVVDTCMNTPALCNERLVFQTVLSAAIDQS